MGPQHDAGDQEIVNKVDVSVVILAFGEEEWLGRAVDNVLASEDIAVEVVVVDNGCTSDAVARLAPDTRLRVVTPAKNLGFAGGVNLGAAHTSAPVIAMVNSDAEVAPSCLSLLHRRLDDPSVGIAGAVILLADEPELVNSAGNPLHVLGLSWSGHLREPLESLTRVKAEAGVSGACMALRREVWDRLGGFPEEFFAYHEDIDLCWRARLLGLRVDLVLGATAVHHYEFSRNDLKMYLMERNRIAFIVTTYGPRTLVVLAVPLMAFELAMSVLALSQGWGRQKLEGWRWLISHAGWLRERRGRLQGSRLVGDRHLARYWTTRFDSSQMPLPAAARPLDWILAVWWGILRHTI